MKKWEKTIVSKAALALYVVPGTGIVPHYDREYHGFVLNLDGAEKEYMFSNGAVMITKPWDFFYLPKGSSYKIKQISKGGCYAINFDADVSDEPFVLSFRNKEYVLKTFKSAEKAWREGADFREMIAIKSVYEIILAIKNERMKKYTPDARFKLITPAIERITSSFTDKDISVADLAELCGISESYFRRIFTEKIGMTPKEYIINMRMNYAKQLLESKQFSVLDVALASGYTEECHFSREFTRRVGISPGQYKKDR